MNVGPSHLSVIAFSAPEERVQSTFRGAKVGDFLPDLSGESANWQHTDAGLSSRSTLQDRESPI